MSALASKTARRLPVLASAAALAIAVSACGIGNKQAHPHYGDTNAFYVDAGPITYQVQITSQLNPYATEDRSYLVGVNSPAPTADEMWFAVFMWAKNQTKNNQVTTAHFTITDSAGNVYSPTPIDPSLNPLAWTSQTLPPGQIEPEPETLASLDYAQGGLILFKLPNSVYSNRPLTLHILPPSGASAMVSLDL